MNTNFSHADGYRHIFKNYVENKNTFMLFPLVSDQLIPTNKYIIDIGVPILILIQ